MTKDDTIVISRQARPRSLRPVDVPLMIIAAILAITLLGVAGSAARRAPTGADPSATAPVATSTPAPVIAPPAQKDEKKDEKKGKGGGG